MESIGLVALGLALSAALICLAALGMTRSQNRMGSQGYRNPYYHANYSQPQQASPSAASPAGNSCLRILAIMGMLAIIMTISMLFLSLLQIKVQ